MKIFEIRTKYYENTGSTFYIDADKEVITKVNEFVAAIQGNHIEEELKQKTEIENENENKN